MERRKTIEMLQTLASSPEGKSESARLAEIIDDVENALKAGVKRQAVLETLHNFYGFKMTMSGFEKALRKLRNNNKTTSTKSNEKSENKKNINNKEHDIHKETVQKETDEESVKSKKYLTPKQLRSIREKALNELDNEAVEKLFN